MTNVELFVLYNSKGGYDIRGAYAKFPDFFRMGTFIDSIDMEL